MQDSRKSKEQKSQRNATLPQTCSTLPHTCSTLPLLGSVAVPTITVFLCLTVTLDFFCIAAIRNTHTEPSVSSAVAAASNFFIS